MNEAVHSDPSKMLAGRYILGKFIGQGGMATVYCATDTKFDRKVAVKIMRPELASDETFRSRFKQEAKSAARMIHPSIVRVFDAGDELVQTSEGAKQLPFIVMEYVEGKNLREYLREGELSIEEACRVIDAVLVGLEHAHSSGIVHRDIKPANIIVTESGKIKVMDFGIARIVSGNSATLKQTTAVLGTAAYFSPEQAKGELVDARSDLYSTGVMLYELVTGMVPFKGDSAVAVAYQHVSERPVLPSERNPRVHKGLDSVILHALAKDRAKRFQNAGEFRQALQYAVQTGEVPPSLRGVDVEREIFQAGSNLSASDITMRKLENSSEAKTDTRVPVLWIWGAVATLITVLAAVVFWIFALNPSPSPSENAIPSVKGQTSSEATARLRELDLQPLLESEASDTVAAGRVIRTDPAEGARVSKYTHVNVIVSTGPQEVTLPNLVGLSMSEADETLKKLDLTVASIASVDDATAPKDRVLRVDPEVGTKVRVKSMVNLTVSSGLIAIPDVRGQTLPEARQNLETLALRVNPIGRRCAGYGSLKVVEQSIVGTQPQRSTVDLVYCTN